MSAQRKIMLITGASGGIGADLARHAGLKGHDLALVARNREALDALADEIARYPGRTAPRPLVLDYDLAAPEAPAAVEDLLALAGASVEILVNNAGYGLIGSAAESDRAAQLGMIDLNIRALTELSLRFSADLIANKGRLLNVASVAAYMPGPGMAVYYASKAYVLSFTEALSKELEPHGVTVTALCPGPVPTGFGARAGFGGMMDWIKFFQLSPEAVAEAGYNAMMAGKRVEIPGLFTKLTIGAIAVMPKSLLLDNVAAVQLRRKREVGKE
ncbi:short-subunit dehydrogenase [Rhodoblastus acidophilus]|nr:short-subunit dehydrogenase [Rhodoblastus acidophilus]